MGALVNLAGKKGLIVGIANQDSIAYGIGKKVVAAGATIAATFLNEKAEQFVRPLAEELKAELILPCNVMVEGQLEAVFEEVTKNGGSSILSSIPSLSLPWLTCTAASSTVLPRPSSRRWTYPAIRSSAWPNSPNP